MSFLAKNDGEAGRAKLRWAGWPSWWFGWVADWNNGNRQNPPWSSLPFCPLWNKLEFILFAWSLGQSSWYPVLHGLGWAWDSVWGYRRGIVLWEFKILWVMQEVPDFDLFIHFPLWIHGVEWCLCHWWLLSCCSAVLLYWKWYRAF